MTSYEDDKDIEIELETQEGRTLTLRKTAIEDGGAVAVLSDITERKRAERELQQSQDQLSEMLDASPIGVSIVKLDGQRIFANERFAEMYGRKKDDLIGEKVMSAFADKKIGRDMRAANTEQGFVDDREVELNRADGSIYWALMTVRATTFAGQEAHIAWVYDITGRKEAERIASEQREMLQAVLDNMAQGVVLYDADECVRLFNNQARALMDFSKDVLHVGANFRDLVVDLQSRGALTTADADASVAQLREGKKSDQVQEVELLRTDGAIIQIHRRNLADGGVVATQTDITEHRQAEAAARAYQENLRRLIEDAALGVIVNNLEGILFANQAVCDIVGIKSPQDIGSDFDMYSLIVEEDRPILAERQQRRAQGQEVSSSYWLRMQRLDGEIIWIESQVQEVKWEGQDAVLAWITDITERKQSEIEMQRQKNIIETTLETIDQGILMVDKDLQIAAYN